ncbi:hypothetical protein E2320_010357 [Naja naja]|nr:hypothetical protein E2320_010357 [Naja naja]
MATVMLWRLCAASLDNLRAKKAKEQRRRERGGQKQRVWKDSWPGSFPVKCASHGSFQSEMKSCGSTDGTCTLGLWSGGST